MRTALRNVKTHLWVSVGLCLLVFCGIFALPVAAIAKRSAPELSRQDIIAELHRRGIDPNKHPRGVHESRHKKQTTTSTSLKPLTVPGLARLALPSVVRLNVMDPQGVPSVQGSGVVIGENLIATNWHVVKNAHAVTAVFQSGRSEIVDGLVNCDSSRDLVILHTNTAGVHPLSLAFGEFVVVGEPVVAVGSPEGLGGSVSTGIISAFRYYNNAKTIQTTAPISHGSSGGALLDMYGRVLGITSFFVADGQNLNFAYSSYHLKQLLVNRKAGFVTWRQIEDSGNKPNAAASLLPNNPAPVPANAASEGGCTNKPLTGLKGVWVCIEDIKPDAKKDGLDPDQLKVEVELRLRKAGITVFDKISSEGNDSAAIFDINVNTSKRENGMYVYSISSDLLELTHLLRPTATGAQATTWSTGSFGTVGATNMATSLRQDMDDDTDKFANDYLAQNPK